MVKVNPVIISVLEDAEDEDGEVQVYCAQHRDKVLAKKEFRSPVTGEWINFSGGSIYLTFSTVVKPWLTRSMSRLHPILSRAFDTSSTTRSHDKASVKGRQGWVYLRL